MRSRVLRSMFRTPLAGALLAGTILAGTVLVGTVGGCGPEVPPVQRMADEYYEKIRHAPDPALWDIFRASNERAAAENGDAQNARGVELSIRYIEVGAAHAEATRDPDLATRILDLIHYLRERDRIRVYDVTLPGYAKRLEDANRRLLPFVR